MPLEDELIGTVEVASAFVTDGEELAGVLAAEPVPGRRVYLCAYESAARVSWLAFDAEGAPIADRTLVRESVSIVGLCELAEESAGGGDLELLRSQLVELRETEGEIDGLDEAQEAVAALEGTIAAPPRVASPNYLDAIGGAATRLERALGEHVRSPFAEAMQAGSAAIDQLAVDVESNYKRSLV